LAFAYHPDSGGIIPQIHLVAFDYYAGERNSANRPILLLLADSGEGSKYPRISVQQTNVWLLTDKPDEDLKHCFPGWKIVKRLRTVDTWQTVEIQRS
jgi:hypothetical protein